MAAITYKSVIKKAIDDFNSIQNSIAQKSTSLCSTADSATTSTLVETSQLPVLIRNNLVFPSGNLTITEAGTFRVATEVSDGTNRTGYETVEIAAAKNFTATLVKKDDTATVGTLSGGYYSLTNTFTTTFEAANPGWFTTGTHAATAAVSVGRIKQGTINAPSTEEVSGSLKITPSYTAGYLSAADALTQSTAASITIEAANFEIDDSVALTFDPEEVTTTISGATNIHAASTVSLNAPTEGFVLPIKVSASGSGAVKLSKAGYIATDWTETTINATGNDIVYAKIDSAAGNVELAELSGDSDITQTVTKVEAIGNQDGSTNISTIKLSDTSSVTGAIQTSEPTSGYYIAVKNAATSTTVSTTADSKITKAGYISVDSDSNDNFTSVTKSKTISTAEKYTYVPVAKGTCTINGGSLSGGAAITPSVGISHEATTLRGVTVGISENAPGANTYYIKVNANSGEGQSTVTRADITRKHTAGFIENQDTATVIAQDSKTVVVNANSAARYLTIPGATLSATKTESVTYTEKTGLALTGGKLYINAGFIENSYITLSELIPDIEEDAAAPHIRAGFQAYDEAGNVLTGTIADTTLSGNYYTTDASKGVASSVVTGNTFNTTTQYIIKGATPTVSLSGGTAVKPTLSKVDIGSSDATIDKAIDGDIYNATGNITTTAPSSGYYIAVKSGSGSSTVTATTSGNKGWVDDYSDSKPITVNVNESDTHYIPVHKAALTPEVSDLIAPQVNVTASTGGFVKSSVQTKFSVSLSGSETNGSVHAKYTAGEAGFVSKDSTLKTTTATVINPVLKFEGTEQNSSTVYIPEGKVEGGVISISNNTTSPNTSGEKAVINSNITGDYVKVVADRSAITVNAGYIDGTTNGMTGSAKDSAETKIAAALNPSVTAGTPSASISFTAPTTFSNETGEASSSAKTATGNIAAVTVLNATTDYKDKYIVGTFTAKTNAGTATATIGADVTGADVDDYVEQLYKRILGKTYHDVEADV